MLNPQHQAEIVEGSGVSKAIAELNFWTVTDPSEADGLLNRNADKRWKHSDNLVPGWAVAGIDPQTEERWLQGIQLKPDTPALNQEGKAQKYLGVSGYDSAPLFLDNGQPGYWPNVLSDRSIPIYITEGAKKAACLLTLAYAAISLPGVWNGQIKGRLKKAIQQFCGVGRKVYLCFDSDQVSNPQVQKALDRLGKLLSAEGCVVYVVAWNEQYKGIDDLVVGLGSDAIHTAIKSAQTFEEWRSENKQDWIQAGATKEQILGSIEACRAKPTNGADEDKPNVTFLQQAVNKLYSDAPWICFGGTLYCWQGNHYEQRSDDVELPRIQAFCNTFKVEKTDKEGGATDAYPYAKPRNAKEVLEWQKMSCMVTADRVNPPGINCTNGVIELRWHGRSLATELVPHDPDRHLYLSEPLVTYNADADPTNYNKLMECLEPKPREIWERTIAASLNLATVRKFKGRAVRALLLKGDGSNGKDTIRMAAEMILGSGAMSSCSATDFKDYDSGRAFPIYALRGKLVNWPSENADVGRIDQLRGLRAAITGDPITFEQKHKDPVREAPKAVFLFNINESPQIVAQLKATASRWGVVPFTKTYSEKPGKGELKADPRFKEDPEFIQQEILPAFLNRLLTQLQNVVIEGIDYTATQHVLEEIQRESSHLLQFAQELRLEADPEGSVTVAELWEKLKAWYIENGTLTIETGARKGQKLIWQDQPSKCDRNVKGQNQVVARFLEIFPKAKRGKAQKEGTNNYQATLTGIKFCAKIGQDDQDGQDKNAESNEPQGLQQSYPNDQLGKILGKTTPQLGKTDADVEEPILGSGQDILGSSYPEPELGKTAESTDKSDSQPSHLTHLSHLTQDSENFLESNSLVEVWLPETREWRNGAKLIRTFEGDPRFDPVKGNLTIDFAQIEIDGKLEALALSQVRACGGAA